jgi:hypothetical protein
MAAPNWQAALNGFPGNTAATDASAQVNQFLLTHGVTPVYAGAQIVTPGGSGLDAWLPSQTAFNLNTSDIDQPFTLPTGSTAIGRVQVPIVPVGAGADLQVSLCADNGSGQPGTVLATTTLPATWQQQLSWTMQSGVVGPLALPQYNQLRTGAWTEVGWTTPSASASANVLSATPCCYGDYMFLVGGNNNSPSALNVNTVYVLQYLGDGAVSGIIPQPTLPTTLAGASVMVTPTTIVVAGGIPSGSTIASAVYTASWDSGTGTIGAWSTQTSLPQAVTWSGNGGAQNGQTVYTIGGFYNISSTNGAQEIYYATVNQGQISSWSSANISVGSPQGFADIIPAASVIGDNLVLFGPIVNGAGGYGNAVYNVPLNGTAPLSMTVATASTGADTISGPASPVGDIGFTTTTTYTTVLTDDVLCLSYGPTGPGILTKQAGPVTGTTGLVPGACFSNNDGTYQTFYFGQIAYVTARVYPVFTPSIPLPVSGLTAGATYHILLHQPVTNLNNYVAVGTDYGAAPMLTSARGANTWSAYATQAIPIGVFDQTVGGPVLHTWEDGGARTSTLVYTSLGNRLVGICEATGFASGVSAGQPVMSAVTQINYDSANVRPLSTTQLA